MSLLAENLLEFFAERCPKKQWEVIPRPEGEVIVFHHDDMNIEDPFISECGRDNVSPEQYYQVPSGVAVMLAFSNILLRSGYGQSRA